MNTFTEEVYDSNVPIKYVFEKGKMYKDNLIIIFSSTNVDKVDENNKYDYLEELKKVDCNKLFILDNYGPGCYYLGFNLNFEVETSIVSLISYISSITGVEFKNIITAGINKGGTAALYFGLKYNFGNVIVGNPHIKIADFVLNHSKNTAEYLLGFNPTQIEINKLNNIIINQLNKNVMSEISILTGVGSTVKEHTDFLIKELNDRSIQFELTENIKSRNFTDIRNIFQKFLIVKLMSNFEKIEIEKVVFDKNFNGYCKVKIESEDKTWITKNEIQLVLKNKNGIIKSYNMDGQLLIPHNELKNLLDNPELVSFNIIISRDSIKLFEIPLELLLIGKDLILKGTDLSINNGKLSFEIDIENSEVLEYAFYIRKNNKVIQKVMYSPSKELEIPITSPGKYQVQYFIRNKITGNKILSQKTKIVEIDNALLAVN